MSLVVNPYSYFTDTNGNALNGYLYVGEVGKNAENYPIAIFYDALFTTPAPNPLTISAGYIYNSGTIAQIYASVDYSIVVKKTDGSLVYSSLNETGMTNGAIANIDEMKHFVAPYNNYALNVLGNITEGDGEGGTFYYDANSTETADDINIIEPASGSGRWIRVIPLYTQAYTIETVDDFDSIPSGYTTVIVKDTDRGGVFNRIASTTANGGTIFDGTTGYSWERQYSGAVNVKWFPDNLGMSCGSGNDDTTGISDALEYVLDKNAVIDGYGGVYKITSTISKTLDSNISWVLQNLNFTTTTITEPGSETGVINLTGDLTVVGGVWSGTNRIIVKNTTFTDSRTSAIGNLDGLYLTGFNQVELDDLIVKGYSGTGVLVLQSQNVNVQNCSMTYNLYAGLRYGTIETLTVTGGDYSYNGIDSPNYGYGISGSAGTGTTTRDVLIQGVTANYNLRKGIDFHAGTNARVIGNTIIGYGQVGIYAVAESGTTNVNNVTIIGNRISGADNTLVSMCIAVGGYGYSANASGNFIISNNTLTGCTVAGDTGNAINVVYPQTGGTITSVTITDNVILNGSNGTNPIINFRNNGATRASYINVSGNMLYANSATMGIEVSGAAEYTIVANNTISLDGTATYAINLSDNTTYFYKILGNQICGGATYTAYFPAFSSTGATFANNTAKGVALPNVYPTGIRTLFDNSIPTSGFYRQGSIIYNTSASSGGYAGWICVTSGSPGTWKTFGAITA